MNKNLCSIYHLSGGLDFYVSCNFKKVRLFMWKMARIEVMNVSVP